MIKEHGKFVYPGSAPKKSMTVGEFIGMLKLHPMGMSVFVESFDWNENIVLENPGLEVRDSNLIIFNNYLV